MRVTARMLGQALEVVEVLRGIHMAAELGHQIKRMLGSSQSLRIEIVEGKYVFQQVRYPMAANAPGLARVVQSMSDPVGAGVEGIVVERLVDSHSPENDGRMVEVPPDHRLHVAATQVLPIRVPDVLPAGNFLQHQ
jgi:hypothetical protein